VTRTKAFSPDYATARHRFREVAADLGWRLEAHPVGATGPAGEDLTIDVALAGDSSDKALVVSSGIHGVEGFFGSAVQLALLDRWAGKTASAPSIRCVFLHALNPYGFAWLRRANEHNVDLNRNFLLPEESYAGAPEDYTRLNGLLNPRRPASWWEPLTLKALWTIARYGMPALRQAIAGGQYDYPQGLFFGGTGPARTTQLIDEHMGRWLSGCKEVVHLDFHTGLGASGTCKLLLDDPPTERLSGRLTDWFGAGTFEVSDSRGIAYRTRGGLGRWCVHRGVAPDYLFACAEFGTYGPLRVLAGLRSENLAHHWGQPSSAGSIRAKRRLRELFCPSSEKWRHQVLARSCDLVDRAVRGISGSPRPVGVTPPGKPSPGPPKPCGTSPAWTW
jgi:hypothetical protein